MKTTYQMFSTADTTQIDHPASDEALPEDARASGRTSSIDRHVGRRIRARRIELGLSQQQMATMIKVTYQQAHKYERGLNRISAGRLFALSLVIGVPVSWFFEGLDNLHQENPAQQSVLLELARNFAAIDNEKQQDALSQMARALSQQSAAAHKSQEK